MQKKLNELLKEYSDSPKFIESINKGVEDILNIAQSENQKTIIISDSKDADGFGSEIVLKEGLSLLNEFFGNSNSSLSSDRIGGFSKDIENPFHPKNIQEIYGKGNYIIADLGSLNPQLANKHLENLLFIDHHPISGTFDPKFTIINPTIHNLNGSKELSSSMIASLIINLSYEKIEEEYKSPEFKTTLKKLRDKLDFISLFGLAGSKADTQDYTGHNRALYDYLENKGLIEKINSPFYGYTSKHVDKIWAQTDPFYNFAYEVPSLNELKKIFSKISDNLEENHEKIIEKLHLKYKYLFTTEKNPSINIPFAQTLNEEEINEINSLSMKILGKEILNLKKDDENIIIETINGFSESNFSNYTDNLLEMEKRLEKAKINLNKLGYDYEGNLKDQKGLSSKLVSRFKDNLTAFANKEDLKFLLNRLEQKQYISKMELPFVNTSISELANLMTAMSKLDEGPIMLNGIHEIIENYDSFNESESMFINSIYDTHKKYKLAVFTGMEELSKVLLDKKKYIKLKDELFYCNMDFLSDKMAGIKDLSKMNGVLLGIAANNQLFPSGNTIAFSGITYEENGKEYIKISGRATNCEKFQNIKINSLMNLFGGGGHNTAAACRIPKDNLEEFLKTAAEFNYNI